jgi:hypothetical protein
MVAGGVASRKVGAAPLVPHTDGSQVQLIIPKACTAERFCTEYENPGYWVIPSRVRSATVGLRVWNWSGPASGLEVIGSGDVERDPVPGSMCPVGPLVDCRSRKACGSASGASLV